MKRWILLVPSSVLLSFFLFACRPDSSMDASLYTVEVIDGVRHVHNHAAQFGHASDVQLILLGKIGKLESEAEQDVLFDPVDAARLPNGDILILEGRGGRVKRYDQTYAYVSSFGQPGRGPGDLFNPYALRSRENRIVVVGGRVSLFTSDGGYEDGFKPPVIARFGSIGAEYRTSGMALLSGPRVFLPSPPSIWLDTGEPHLFSAYDQKGNLIRSFGAFKSYEEPSLTLSANIAYFAADDNDRVYVAYAHQNRIDKFSLEGERLFSADRSLPYEIENVMKVEVFKSGNMEREFPFPSVSSVTKGIGIDHQNRIWILTFLKQPNRFLTFDQAENLTDCYEFDVFDPDGIHLFEVPFPNVRFDGFSIYDDRLFLIDARHESCVYEYRIIG